MFDGLNCGLFKLGIIWIWGKGLVNGVENVSGGGKLVFKDDWSFLKVNIDF